MHAVLQKKNPPGLSDRLGETPEVLCDELFQPIGKQLHVPVSLWGIISTFHRHIS